MKKTFLMLAILFTSMVASAQGINFQDLTLDQAIAKAKSENKFVFIDTYTDWCGPCKMMDKEIYPMKEMGDYFNPKFVSVKFNAEKGEEGPAVKKKFGINAYPTFVILDGDGNLLHMFAGGILSLAFIDKVEESFNPEKAFGVLQKSYNDGNRDKKLVANYLKALGGTFTVDNSKMVEEFANSLSDDEIICEECLFIFDDMARLESPRGKFVIDNLEKFRNKIGRDKTDLLLKKKFEAYYAGILGRQRNPVQADIDEKNLLLNRLNLTNSDILNIYKEAIAVYMSKSGAQQLCKSILSYPITSDKNEMDRFLYFTIPALAELWSEEQTQSLVALINNAQAADKIKKDLERKKKI
ncbi:MAG: thioredoxin family protein [Bacteroidales bacterium]